MGWLWDGYSVHGRARPRNEPHVMTDHSWWKVEGQRNKKVVHKAPAICATINKGTSDGRIPAKVTMSNIAGLN